MVKRNRSVVNRVVLAVVLTASVVLGGCGQFAPVPYNGRQSCDGVGGLYTADGRCLGGSA